MDGSGLETSLLERSGADIAYVMPSHQYPTGIVMPVKRRQELLSWACKKEGRYLIEDDYDSEFRYKGKPIPALQGMDGRERVIYSGTFSKSVAPAIRVSYLVLPKPPAGGLPGAGEFLYIHGFENRPEYPVPVYDGRLL